MIETKEHDIYDAVAEFRANHDEYAEFLKRKAIVDPKTGFEPEEISSVLFDFQRDIVRWAIKRGRAAIFSDCGTGKTAMQLEWAHHICQHEGGTVLILAPLGVTTQTPQESIKLFGREVTICESDSDVKDGGVNITNYEKLHKFNPRAFDGVVLDESSILKCLDGKTRTQIIEAFRSTRFKLACTATPSPNDYMELGNHAEFLGVMTHSEMLSMFFVHDGGDTSKWRLKGHAEKEFWKWVCSWAVNIRKPSDLGYEDGDFILPELKMHEIVVSADCNAVGTLFPMPASSLDERRAARKGSISERCAAAVDIISKRPGEQFLIWVDRNDEQDELEKLLGDKCVSIRGATKDHARLSMLDKWLKNESQCFLSKPSIFGFGLNLQVCHNVIYVGLSDSQESFYQSVRRVWRFGQKSAVDCWIVTSDLEGAVVANIKRKEADAIAMYEGMVANMKDITREEVRGVERDKSEYKRRVESGKDWTLHLGDCVEASRDIPDNSIHFSVFSPPFASLYVYSNSDRDMGNCKDSEEFMAHFKFLVKELYRATMPGRLCSFHCMNLPTSKSRDGVIGIHDFRGDLIRCFANDEAAEFHAVIARLRDRQRKALDAREMNRLEDLQQTIFRLETELTKYTENLGGWIYHSEVCIWKDPVTAMQRTKALGLLHKQLKKDSCMSRQGIPDYLVTMRKPGDNPERVTHTNDSFPVQLWQQYASPIWMDIQPNDTLQKESAREHDDERHICPLQLEVIERAISLWSNPGDLVFSPFAGIGSEGYVAVKMNRKFLGVELKESYFNQAKLNLKSAESGREQSLFGD